MNNLYNLQSSVDTINFKTLPSIFEIIQHINLHVGEFKLSCRCDDFHGWKLCDGRSLSREDYPDLFDIIGTTFGANDSQHFNIPDMRGRVFGAVGQGIGLTNRSFGSLLGEEFHTLSTNEIPSHSHTASTATAGLHNHGSNTAIAGNHSHNINDPGHTHTQHTINDDFNNSGSSPPGFAGDSAGSMTWSNIDSSTTGISINSSGVHSHAIQDDGNHSHSVTVIPTGGGDAHNNMQPTGFVGYIFIFSGMKPSVNLVNSG